MPIRVWLAAVEAQMASPAAAVHFARADSLGASAGADPPRASTTATFPSARLALTPLFEDGARAAVLGRARGRAAGRAGRATRGLDRAAGRTLLGPHRVDFEVRYAQKDMPAALGSTGEQKALLIGLILAQARLVARMTGIAPFLLLDEIAAHLDPDRRAALFAALDGLGTQCFMTGTDPMLFEALGDRARSAFPCKDGRLCRRRAAEPKSDVPQMP